MQNCKQYVWLRFLNYLFCMTIEGKFSSTPGKIKVQDISVLIKLTFLFCKTAKMNSCGDNTTKGKMPEDSGNMVE